MTVLQVSLTAATQTTNIMKELVGDSSKFETAQLDRLIKQRFFFVQEATLKTQKQQVVMVIVG